MKSKHFNVRGVITKVVAVACVAALACTPAMAASYKSYATTVKKTSDYETAGVVKETTGSAYNKVTLIESGCSLVSWMEYDSSGVRISGKTSYSSTGKKTMDYTNASTRVGHSVVTNISTAATQLSSVYTEGSSTPN